ncbi:MAG: RdgB/HAM1 family non-canonical purine NTP pyrophosphatase [Anaerolineales bacterium]|nr:RdgB/HAM1 family non-canonical purine NTP pyrophosphatase [Anaerolineales bacterium]
MSTLLIASGNPGKLLELRALLQTLSLTLIDPATLQLELDVVETGADYAANASLKASTYAQASGLYTLADDSGLEVDALEGAPGKHSARLAGPDRSDADRRRMLLDLLQPHPRPWTARFCCTVALAGPDGSIDLASGSCSGEIITEERGAGGFGYDPIFSVQDAGQTMAELSMPEKNRISHRARAVQAILPILKRRMGIQEEGT